MKMKYEIRPCTAGDIDVLWEKPDGITDGCSGRSEKDAAEELHVFKVTDDHGTVIAGCVLDIDKTKTAEFNSLWVDERYRKRGLGTALIRAAEQKAKEKGCREIINAYTFDFQEAKSLFEELGYRLIGITKDWPKGHEAYTLIKDPGDIPRDGFPQKFPDNTGTGIRPGSGEDAEIIHNALESTYRNAAPRLHQYLDLDKKLTDDEDKMIAGCIAGISGWDTLHIDMIWVNGRYRNRGLGTYLLDEIEREAKEKGAYLARTGVSAMQAVFFKKRGYSVNVIYGSEPEWYDMQKRLDR